MALEWTIEGGQAVDPQSLAEQVRKTLEGLAETSIVMHLEQDVQENSEPAEGDPVSSFVLKSEIAEEWSNVEVQQFASDPSTGIFLGYISSYRSKHSVVLGVIVAAQWNMAAGGNLSGTGLGGQRLTPDESERLLADLFRGASWAEKVERAAGKLGCGQLD